MLRHRPWSRRGCLVRWLNIFTVPAERARAILDAQWQPQGYTVPNAVVYPHQWLWDSCFHAIVWGHLGEGERALAELRNVFAHQADDGFVPHVIHHGHPDSPG